MEANSLLENKVEALEAEIGDLKALIVVRDRSFDPFSRPASAIAGVAAYVLLPIAAMMVIHFVLVVMLDANLVYLRLATAVLSMLCGYTLEVRRRPSWFATVCLTIFVAVGSVLGMSATIHWMYGSPLLPATPSDRFEMGEYMASIALAYLLGALIAVAARPLRLPKSHTAHGPIELLAGISRAQYAPS